ncbi:MAG TPA: hypothetical protein VF989_06485 [Polyangiaceae bacterium]|jgi:hypothetical protein
MTADGRPRRSRLAALVLVCAASVACTYRTTVITDDGRRLQPIAASAVRFTPERTPPPGAVVVGLVAVNVTGDADDAMVELSHLAAEAGANWVYALRLEQVSSRVGVSGLAVRLGQ